MRLRRRRLLDTEKVVFVANQTGAGAGTTEATPAGLPGTAGRGGGQRTCVRVTAARRSVTYREDVRRRPVIFNILLDRLYFGAVPPEALKVAGFCVLLLACVVRSAPWLASNIARESTQHAQ